MYIIYVSFPKLPTNHREKRKKANMATTTKKEKNLTILRNTKIHSQNSGKKITIQKTQ